MSNDKYRKAIFNAQVAMNTGSVTYEQAVDMACKDMLDAGLNCVEYKNGARHTLSDYADMAIKTANKRAYLRGEGEERAKYGLSLVVVNSRQGGCPKCAEYIGKVFIDDVYSGGTQSDGKYPLLSNAIAGGLFHPRCKDSTSTYYEGITTLSPVTAEEMAEMDRREQLEAQQQYAERQAQRFDRRAKYSLDEDNKRIAQTRADEWHDRADMLEEKAKKAENTLPESVAKSADNGIIKTESRDYSAVGSNAFSDSAKQKLLQDERILSGNDYETAIIYNADGSRKFSKKGKSKDVNFTDEQIDKMKGCILTHNHPNGTVFSPEDINMLREGQLSEIRACNGKGSYVLRNAGGWHKDITNLKTIEKAYWECMNTVGARYADISAQEGKPIFAYFRKMDEDGLKLFSEKYGLEFSWEDKI